MLIHNKRNTTFDLALREAEKRLAVWYKSPSGKDYLVNPRLFFNAIVGDKEEKRFLVRDMEDFRNNTNTIYSDIIFDEDLCFLLVDDTLNRKTDIQKIAFSEFWEKVRACFASLYEKMQEKCNLYYEDEVRKEDIDRIVRQLNTAELYTNPMVPCTSEIKVDYFGVKVGDFNLQKNGDSEIAFTFTIGEKSFTCHHLGAFEFFRHQLENFVFNSINYILGESTIELFWDYGRLKANIKIGIFLTDEIVESGNGSYGHQCTQLAKTVIRPHNSIHGPAIIGICEPKQVVREMYEALLDVGRRGFSYGKSRESNDWYTSPIVLYNDTKSNIIEDYINGIRTPFDEVQKRQTMIKHVYTICPGNDHTLFHDEEGVGFEAGEDDTVTFGETIMKVSGIYAWQKEFETKMQGADQAMGTLDSRDWYQRGIILAQQLRQQLPNEYDLWYKPPFKDAENSDKRAILLYKNHNAVCSK